MPPPIINIYYFDQGQHSKLIDEVKALALKEHEIYSVINDKLHSLSSDVESLLTLKHVLAKDRAIFKQKIDDVQIKLTSPTLEQKVIDFTEYNKGNNNSRCFDLKQQFNQKKISNANLLF